MYENFAYYYDSLGWERFSHVQAERILGFIEEKQLHVKTVLDLACGTGTFCFLMAEKGMKVTGLDLSKDMLAVAKKKVKERGIKGVRFHRADMTDFDLRRRFDLVTCNFDSLNHLLSEQKVLSAFQRVSAHLNENGAFIFDMNTIAGLHNWRFRDTRQTADSVILRHGVFDEEEQTALLFIDAFVRAEEDRYIRFQDTFKEKGYPVSTIYALLSQAGFRETVPFGPSAGKSLRDLERDPRVLLYAEKG